MDERGRCDLERWRSDCIRRLCWDEGTPVDPYVPLTLAISPMASPPSVGHRSLPRPRCPPPSLVLVPAKPCVDPRDHDHRSEIRQLFAHPKPKLVPRPKRERREDPSTSQRTALHRLTRTVHSVERMQRLRREISRTRARSPTIT